MNYIFLDVDGVLNNKNYYEKMHKKYGGRFFCEDMPFNPRSLKNLRKIIDRTGGKELTSIVLTSSWRRSEKCMTVLEARLIEYGIKIKKGYCTPHIDGKRGAEITDWLHKHVAVITTLYNDNIRFKSYDIPREHNFIILDDEMYDIEECFTDDHIVKIDWTKGLTYWKTMEAIEKLNNFNR